MSETSNAPAASQDFQFEALAKATNYRAALLREFAPFLRGQVLEVGAGIGQFTGELSRLPTIEKLVALEPEPRFCETFRKLHPHCPLVEGTLDALPRDFRCDTVVSVNVLEHIAGDEAELVRYRGLLAPGSGQLCLFVPACPQIYGPIDRDFGHYRRYTRRELGCKLLQAGLSVVRLNYFNSVGFFVWWVSFCLLRKRRFSLSGVAFFDRVIFPIAHGVERTFLRPPFGQSLLAVARVAS
jgi:SAM-dependent methyltransferase